MKPYREGSAARTLVVRQPVPAWFLVIYGGAALTMLGSAIVILVATLATSPAQLLQDPTAAGMFVLALVFAAPVAVPGPRVERVPLMASRWRKWLEKSVAPFRQFVGLSVPET